MSSHSSSRSSRRSSSSKSDAPNAREVFQQRFAQNETLTDDVRLHADFARQIRKEYAGRYLAPVHTLKEELNALLDVDSSIYTSLTHRGVHVLSQHLLDPFPPENLAPDSMRCTGKFVGLLEIDDLLSSIRAHANHVFAANGTTRHDNLAASFFLINAQQSPIHAHLDRADKALKDLQKLENALFLDLARTVPERFVRRQPTFDPFPPSKIARDTVREVVGAGGSPAVEENHTPDGRLIFGLTDALHVISLLFRELNTSVDDALASPEHVQTHDTYRFDTNGEDRVHRYMSYNPLHIPRKLRENASIPSDLTQWPDAYENQQKDQKPWWESSDDDEEEAGAPRSSSRHQAPHRRNEGSMDHTASPTDLRISDMRARGIRFPGDDGGLPPPTPLDGTPGTPGRGSSHRHSSSSHARRSPAYSPTSPEYYPRSPSRDAPTEFYPPTSPDYQVYTPHPAADEDEPLYSPTNPPYHPGDTFDPPDENMVGSGRIMDNVPLQHLPPAHLMTDSMPNPSNRRQRSSGSHGSAGPPSSRRSRHAGLLE